MFLLLYSNVIVDSFADGVVLRQGSYLSATADIGVFEHSLTTDLLNHLVFVQKVFMKEVNEVVQKVYGGEKPVPLWLEDDESTNSTLKRILFSLIIRIKVKKYFHNSLRFAAECLQFCLLTTRNICWKNSKESYYSFTEDSVNCHNSNEFSGAT